MRVWVGKTSSEVHILFDMTEQDETGIGQCCEYWVHFFPCWIENFFYSEVTEERNAIFGQEARETLIIYSFFCQHWPLCCECWCADDEGLVHIFPCWMMFFMEVTEENQSRETPTIYSFPDGIILSRNYHIIAACFKCNS